MATWSERCEELHAIELDHIAEQFASVRDRIRAEYDARLAAEAANEQAAIDSCTATKNRRLLFGGSVLAQHVFLFRAAQNNPTLFTDRADVDALAISGLLPSKLWPEAMREPIQEYVDACCNRISSILGRDILPTTQLDSIGSDTLDTALTKAFATTYKINELRGRLVVLFMTIAASHRLDGRELILPGAAWHSARSAPLSANPELPTGFVPLTDYARLCVPAPPQTLLQLSHQLLEVRDIVVRYQRQTSRELAESIQRRLSLLLVSYGRPAVAEERKKLLGAIAGGPQVRMCAVFRCLNVGIHHL